SRSRPRGRPRCPLGLPGCSADRGPGLRRCPVPARAATSSQVRDTEAMTTIAEGLTLEDTTVAELQGALRGQIVGRDDPGYDEHREIWNGSINRRPALIARCAGVADVTSAVKFARQHGLRVAIRSGGHSFPGLSVADDALMIDLSPMKGVRVDPHERTARVQA